MRLLTKGFFLTVILLTACGPTIPAATSQTISVEYTAASIPWLADITNCSGGNTIKSEQVAADFQNPQSYDLSFRIGQPDNLVSPAFQIGSEEILVIENTQNPVKVLTADQVKGLFNGQISNWKEVGGPDSSLQVWAFASGEDIQQVFEKAAMDGSPVTSSARLATSPDEMAQAIANDINAVGILTRHWKASNVMDTFTTPTIPVLVLTKTDPQTDVQNIIACLQNKAP
jgi:hypothetical protein